VLNFGVNLWCNPKIKWPIVYGMGYFFSRHGVHVLTLNISWRSVILLRRPIPWIASSTVILASSQNASKSPSTCDKQTVNVHMTLALTENHACTHARTNTRMHARMHACTHACTHTHTHTHTFNGLFSRTTWVSWHQKGKPFWILLKQEMTGGNGISWTICKSFALHSRQTTMPVPHHLIFYGPDALPDAKPTVSKQWRQTLTANQANYKLT